MSTREHEDASNELGSPLHQNLPGSKEIQWERTAVGPADRWPPLLKSFTTFIASLPHPAALYWGEGLSLIFNEPWGRVQGDAMQQGQAQLDRLDEGAVKSLSRTMEQQVSANADANSFLDHAPQDSRLILSPLVDFGSVKTCGVMAQLLHFEPVAASFARNDSITISEGVHGAALPQMELGDGSSGVRIDSANFPVQSPDGDGTLDELPLDEHPVFRRIAAMLPTGIAILNHKAEAVFVNRQFYELTTHVEGDKSFKAWPHTIHPDHFESVMQAYQEAVKTQEPLRMEFRCQGDGDPWRLLLLTPLGHGHMRHASLREHGGFICAVIDITSNKMAELAQRKAAKEAQERKDQQGRFVDMISHEIRNPLSAVLHCAEDILDSLKSNESRVPRDVKDLIVEAADTITLCVAHQKSIVDDILSFSKLDSSMLSLCPQSVQPERQLADSLRMFQPEFRKQSIKFEYKVDQSYHDSQVDWVKADLVRIGQVLVNLITNAIKFTAKKNGGKEITVATGVSTERPASYPPNVVFFDTGDLGYRMEGTNTSEWGNGETVYIMVAVIDTGIGISDESQKKLFQRFRQATSRTEELYGGSGLGLNISRKLCQLHGGEIGVKSKAGEGSVFGFYFKVRRTEVPQGESPPASERLDSKELNDQAKKFEASPVTAVNENEVPSSLKDPNDEHTAEAVTEAARNHQWGHTAEIASHVKDKSLDRQGVVARPSNSRTASYQSDKGPKASPSTEVSQQDATTSSPNTKILVVEDNIINQRLLRRKLEARGFSVLTANDGREAVDAVQAAGQAAMSTGGPHVGFDVVLMDQEMPTMDGNTASRAIREWEEDLGQQEGVEQRVPILGVTANVREQQKDNMKDAGMDDVITKPYKIDEMVDKINSLLDPKGHE